MTAPNVNRQQDTLGKLLATEDIRIVRHASHTASFDTTNRVLYLPTWAGVSKNVVDLFIGHEVAHALWTRDEDWHRVLKDNPEYGFKQFLNIVEDARIEKKIKRRYPGLRKPMFDGYDELVRSNFFQCGYDEFNKLLFVDRLNIHFKVGSRAGIKFSADEQVFVDAIEAAETWEEVEDLTLQLWGFAEAEREMLRQQKEAAKEAAKKAKKMPKQEQPSDDEDEEEKMVSSGEAIQIEDEDDDSTDSEDDSDDDAVGESDDDETDEDTDSDEKGSASDKGDDEDEEDADESDDTEGKGKSSDDEDADSDEDGKESSDSDSDGEKEDAEGSGGRSGKGASSGGEQTEVDRKVEKQLESEEGYSLTEEAFKKAQEKAVDLKNKVPTFAVMPRLTTKDWIVGYREMYKEFDGERTLEHVAAKREQRYETFMRANKAYVNLLVQAFEMKRKARRLAGARTSKTGKLDINRAYRFNFSEDIFSSTTIVPEGTNHGMLQLLDMSSSMSDVMGQTLEQMIILAMFCRKVRIPFAAYGFADNDYKRNDPGYVATERDTIKGDPRDDKDPQSLLIDSWNFHLRELLTSNMPTPVFNSAVKDLLMVARTFSWESNRFSAAPFSGSVRWRLSGTPLIDSLVLLRQVAVEFKRQTGVEVLNTIVLSDGDGTSSIQSRNTVSGDWNPQYIFTDRDTKVTVDVREYGYNNPRQDAMMDMYRKSTGSRLMVLFLAPNKREMTSRLAMLHRISESEGSIEDKVKREWDKEGFVSIDTKFADAYYILDAKEMSAEEVTMDQQLAKSRSKSLFKAFRAMQDQKSTSRVFVNRFIDSIT
jgi:hypothetical protein